MEITKEVKDANWNSAGKLRGQLPRNLERRGIDHRTNPARVLIRRWLRVTGREDVPGQLNGQLLHVFANGNPKIAPQSDLTLSTALAGTPVIAAMLSGLIPHFASLWFSFLLFLREFESTGRHFDVRRRGFEPSAEAGFRCTVLQGSRDST